MFIAAPFFCGLIMGHAIVPRHRAFQSLSLLSIPRP
jgi:hypothetical protein